MASVSMYLHFKGNCKEAFDFYKSVFGGEFGFVSRFGDMPAGEDNSQMRTEDAEKIMHMSLPIGSTMLMGSDTPGEWADKYIQGNNFTISINADSKEEADKLFKGLSEGGQVTMPMNHAFWGDYFGMFDDKFGIGWMVSFNEKQQG